MLMASKHLANYFTGDKYVFSVSIGREHIEEQVFGIPQRAIMVYAKVLIQPVIVDRFEPLRMSSPYPKMTGARLAQTAVDEVWNRVRRWRGWKFIDRHWPF